MCGEGGTRLEGCDTLEAAARRPSFSSSRFPSLPRALPVYALSAHRQRALLSFSAGLRSKILFSFLLVSRLPFFARVRFSPPLARGRFLFHPRWPCWIPRGEASWPRRRKAGRSRRCATSPSRRYLFSSAAACWSILCWVGSNARPGAPPLLCCCRLEDFIGVPVYLYSRIFLFLFFTLVTYVLHMKIQGGRA